MLSAETIGRAVADLAEPIIFTGFRDNVEGGNCPEFLRWDIDEFKKIFGDETLPFRTGVNARTTEPQWDVNCPTEYMTISRFLEKTEYENVRKWYYFDYKYMHQWFRDRPEFLESVDWRRFGFEKNGTDSTLWIGSKGAHTNCHQDSYGCNLVAQLHGRKQWLLFPPESSRTIKPTRVPYEESTVYSKLNFFSPTREDERAIMRMKENVRVVELEPGQVLLVPNGWWHYVESLDTSVSINVWLPVDADYKGRLKEAIVKLLFTNIGEGLPSAPDETTYTRREAVELINTCVRECNKIKTTSSSSPVEKKIRETPWTAQDLANEYPGAVKLLRTLSGEELREMVVSKRERFVENEISSPSMDDDEEDSAFQRSLENVLNALCNVDVVDKVADAILDNEICRALLLSGFIGRHGNDISNVTTKNIVHVLHFRDRTRVNEYSELKPISSDSFRAVHSSSVRRLRKFLLELCQASAGRSAHALRRPRFLSHCRSDHTAHQFFCNIHFSGWLDSTALCQISHDSRSVRFVHNSEHKSSHMAHNSTLVSSVGALLDQRLPLPVLCSQNSFSLLLLLLQACIAEDR